jgi:ornithine cyclodeaminase/alanine dehydrogenase
MSTDGDQPARMPLFLTDSDVERLSDWGLAIEAIRGAYGAVADEKRTPGRIFADSGREWMRIMPSVPTSGRLFGAKSINGSFADGLRVSYLISLFDKDTADLVALIDGNRVTGLRTAATTAVGAEAITPRRPVTVGVIGSGFEARSHLTAFSHVLEFSEIRVFSPTEKNRGAFAADFDASFGAPARAVASAQKAAEGADLILCAARSRDETPTIEAAWVGENATVVSIGSTTPAQRELPADLIARASVVVADTVEEVVHGSGDLIAAREAGVDVDSLVIPLTAALLGERPIDVERGIRIYKSTGSGLQDIVVAEMLYDRAHSQGLGTELPVGIVTNRK